MLAAGVAFSSPPATTLALTGYPQIAGTASSLLGMVRFGFGGIAAPLVGVAGAASILPLGLVTVTSLLLAAGTFLALTARPRAGRSTTTRRRAQRAAVAPRERGTTMRAVVMYAPGDVRVDETERPTIVEPTDAIIKLSATCICGSDLWPYRGADDVDHQPMGHEYVGVVDEIGSAVRTLAVGDFVVGTFFSSDNTCEICRAGYQTHCVHRGPGAVPGAQAEYARIPHADGTLVATPGMPDDDLVPSLLAASDVLGHGVVRRRRRRGRAGQDGRRRG